MKKVWEKFGSFTYLLLYLPTVLQISSMSDGQLGVLQRLESS